jgi:hypothetical protein
VVVVVVVVVQLPLLHTVSFCVVVWVPSAAVLVEVVDVAPPVPGVGALGTQVSTPLIDPHEPPVAEQDEGEAVDGVPGGADVSAGEPIAAEQVNGP